MLRRQEAGPPLFLRFRLSGNRLEFLFHLLEGGALYNQILFFGEKHDFTLGVEHALIKRRVIAKPACPVDVTFLGRHLVKEANESRGIVTGVPCILDSKLVGLELVLPADAQEIQVEGETQTVEPILQSIVSADSGGAAR